MENGEEMENMEENDTEEEIADDDDDNNDDDDDDDDDDNSMEDQEDFEVQQTAEDEVYGEQEMNYLILSYRINSIYTKNNFN